MRVESEDESEVENEEVKSWKRTRRRSSVVCYPTSMTNETNECTTCQSMVSPRFPRRFIRNGTQKHLECSDPSAPLSQLVMDGMTVRIPQLGLITISGFLPTHLQLIESSTPHAGLKSVVQLPDWDLIGFNRLASHTTRPGCC